MGFTLERTRRNAPSPKCKQYPKKLISREGVEINGRGKIFWFQNDMLHRISFESSNYKKGDTPKMQKIEWGFISQILGANFSKSACFKSFQLLHLIGRSNCNCWTENSSKFNDEIFGYGGLNFLRENFWAPITRKRYEIGPPRLISCLRPKVSTIWCWERGRKVAGKKYFFSDPHFPPKPWP
jgi:hypothetical protein